MKNLSKTYPFLTRNTVAILLSAGALAISQAAHAESSCKELKKEACTSSSSCSWINSYTTKKGNTVDAYCRNKPKQKSSKKSAAEREG